MCVCPSVPAAAPCKSHRLGRCALAAAAATPPLSALAPTRSGHGAAIPRAQCSMLWNRRHLSPRASLALAQSPSLQQLLVATVGRMPSHASEEQGRRGGGGAREGRIGSLGAEIPVCCCTWMRVIGQCLCHLCRGGRGGAHQRTLDGFVAHPTTHHSREVGNECAADGDRRSGEREETEITCTRVGGQGERRDDHSSWSWTVPRRQSLFAGVSGRAGESASVSEMPAFALRMLCQPARSASLFVLIRSCAILVRSELRERHDRSALSSASHSPPSSEPISQLRVAPLLRLVGKSLSGFLHRQCCAVS